MLLDARSIPDRQVLHCDVCIVGAGPAGITLAQELAGSGMQVILAEAGGRSRAGDSQSLYAGEVNDTERHLPLDQARYRQLGGTSALWGGRCMAFDAIDFERRDWVAHSGWPIKRSDLEPYYRRAHVYCECGPFAYSLHEALPQAPSLTLPGFADGDVVASTLERWSPPTHFGKRYLSDLERSTTTKVLLRAVAVELRCAPGGAAVSHVQIAALSGNTFTIRARQFVVAGGGLESTRLLLASNRMHGSGIGNHSDWLGRGYMSHIHGAIARATFTAPGEVIFGYETDTDGVYCRRRLTLSESAQRGQRLLNLYALLDRPLLGDPSHGNAMLSAAFLLKRMFGGAQQARLGSGKYALYWQHARNILSGSSQVVSVLPRFGRRRLLQRRRIPSLLMRPRGNAYHLYFQSEQVPDRDNRVTLGRARDALGMPMLELQFRINAADIESIQRAHLLIDRELRRQHCGHLSYETDDVPELIGNCKAVLGHHVGTTRMAADSANGVVDEHCRVHGVSNLFVASSSVFPTSSQANPTLTIVAFAIRLADRLKALPDISLIC